ncbi:MULTISPECIES: FBP domain-containing protein [unclassified Streptomyces]|uniref:FBP domain-containing protein n=1 Tax=unclassified Streptomyces TaxID=2593676 RepID=UPI002033D21C|nr:MULTISPECIES: FBP domain-containing protein [unclassified Streptomyces]MCM2420643.1 FBP domain-containing protein [Streptomyces sp. RKAG293]MCM2427176.1 FBP domain-containing protein [Streptomyces sp. RKAG337]
MEPLVEQQIRASFVNCSKGEARRLNLPRDFADLPWADLDFLGWRDPGAPDRGYLVAPGENGLTGIALRSSGGARRNMLRTSLCSLCVTNHASGGVDLLVAPKAGPAGRNGNTIGTYICADLACSLYVRGKKKVATAQRFEETLTLDEQIARTVRNVDVFLAKVTADTDAGATL